MEGTPKQFTSPEEEIAFLRRQIAEREQTLLERSAEVDSSDVETIGKEQIKEYSSFTPKMILHPDYELRGEELAKSIETVEVAIDPVEEILQLASEKGVRNALTVLDKVNNAFVIDEVHRQLIEQIKNGVQVSDLKEGVPPWHVLHMTLYEVTMPAQTKEGEQGTGLADLVGKMEQLLAGLRTIGSKTRGNHFVIEIAVANNSDDIVFYVAVPNEFKALFEKQTLSLFPDAALTEQVHDYNVYVDGGHSLVADMILYKSPIYPLKTSDEFTADPFRVILNAFSKIERDGGGAAVQFVIRNPNDGYKPRYEEIIYRVENGMSAEESIIRSNKALDIFTTIKKELFSTKKIDLNESKNKVDTEALEVFKKKISSPLFEVNVRVVVSTSDQKRSAQILSELESAFNQFDEVGGNSIRFKEQKGIHLRHAQKAFSFRQFSNKTILPLNTSELATMIHFPSEGIESTSQFKQSHSKTAPAPTEMPVKGTLIGINKHRNVDKRIFISDEDRLRHFYIIGQTGTGKTTLMKNMIVQDIERGDGVCMIDPHGTDIVDVLGAVPPEREKDVIYFDPSHMDRVIGLNMLEFDYSKPEQKTFVVNELFSIFQKLYGANPESMGPMFEQYFRNATMLVMEDPESGNTLMDIARVMTDSRFRREKLSKAKNPVVVQFWTEIATKAGGEASLENIVPYIVSKFDVFTANDYMRPIIGQQHSSFNFRQIMDERKILLVNLSKGRLGEINANLIGMIIIGKILMAALSRVDDPTKGFPPFYLHMDEFQNISTNAISAILSEARKYKLGLTIAHQFIAQLQPDIKDAVFGNVGSMVAFRTGPEDAKFLEHQFAPAFNSNDLMNVPNRNAFARVLADGVPTPPFSIVTVAPKETDLARVQSLIDLSYLTYGRARGEIEAEIDVRYRKPTPPVPPAPRMM